jgi:hypothetical protein
MEFALWLCARWPVLDECVGYVDDSPEPITGSFGPGSGADQVVAA